MYCFDLQANCLSLNRKRKVGFRFLNNWLIDSNVLIMVKTAYC